MDSEKITIGLSKLSTEPIVQSNSFIILLRIIFKKFIYPKFIHSFFSPLFSLKFNSAVLVVLVVCVRRSVKAGI